MEIRYLTKTSVKESHLKYYELDNMAMVIILTIFKK